MAKTEKAAFWILVFLLIVGVAVKFYRLDNESPEKKMIPPRSEMKSTKKQKSPKKTKKSKLIKKKIVSAPEIVNLNSATVQDLERLPQIGLATAERIINYRDSQGPFKEKSDLLRIPGISITKYKKIEPFLILE